MKKVLAVVLCLTTLLSAFLTGGCKDKSVFDGDYREVSMAEVSKAVTYFSEHEESIIDWSNGLKVSLTTKQEDLEISINAKMASSIIDSSKGVGEWEIQMKSNDRTETTQMIYDGLYLYKEVSFAGNTQKTKGKANFNEIIAYSDLEDLDDVIGEFLYSVQELENETNIDKNFYLDDKDTQNIKLKIELFEKSDSFGGANSLMCIVFDKNYSVSALMVEMVYESLYGNEEIYMTLERWSGKVSTPSSSEEYELVDNILA